MITRIVEIFLSRFPITTSFFLCLLKPYRLLYRIKKGRLFYKVPAQGFSQHTRESHILQASEGFDTDEATNVLLKHGVVVLNNYFNKDQIVSFREKYKKFIGYPPSDLASKNGDILPLSPELISMWRDEKIIEVIENVINHEVYGRDYPRFTMVHPRKNIDGSIQIKNTASEIHVDHVSIVSAAVYFTNVTSETSRMQVLSGTHRFLIYPLRFSKKVQQAFLDKFELLDCVGGIGTVQIHLGDVLHRFMPVAESSRLWVQLPFSDGHNILFDPWSMAMSIPRGNEGMSFVEVTEDRFFDGLYPRMPLKGYKLRDGKIHPVKGNNI